MVAAASSGVTTVIGSLSWPSERVGDRLTGCQGLRLVCERFRRGSPCYLRGQPLVRVGRSGLLRHSASAANSRSMSNPIIFPHAQGLSLLGYARYVRRLTR